MKKFWLFGLLAMAGCATTTVSTPDGCATMTVKSFTLLGATSVQCTTVSSPGMAESCVAGGQDANGLISALAAAGVLAVTTAPLMAKRAAAAPVQTCAKPS